MMLWGSVGPFTVAKQQLNGVFQRIRKLAAVQTGRGCSDRELLARFVGEADEAAFTVLVERHGPLVLGLCRRVLRNADDAEDACQATFLVLARKAASLRKRAALGGWLHGVAYRIAANLRRARARRLRREQRVPTPAVYESDGDVTWRELRTVLDEELQRLPQRYRQPLILCYLEGKTRDEAAQELGAGPGALHGLLERGRRLLRERLTQRGLTLSTALLATALTATASNAALPPSLVVASTKTALAVASGQPLASGAIAPHILSLAQEALKTMFVTKLKIGTAVVVCGGLLTALVAGWTGSVGLAQDYVQGYRSLAERAAAAPGGKAESDEDFIRRVSKDLRGIDPSPAEIHFFAANKNANRRQKLIDLFIQERQAKQKTDAHVKAEVLTGKLRVINDLTRLRSVRTEYYVKRTARLSAIQGDYYSKLLGASKDNKEVATITQNYLDRLMQYVKDHPKAEDVADAMLHISLIYRSQGKTVEADAWRDKLRKEHASSPAAKTAQELPHGEFELSIDDYVPELLIRGRVERDVPAVRIEAEIERYAPERGASEKKKEKEE